MNKVNIDNMLGKIKSLLGSIRFWEFTIAAFLFALIKIGVITNEDISSVLDILAKLLGVVGLVGTFDRAVDNLSSK